MSALTKKHRTNQEKINVIFNGNLYRIPISIANRYKVKTASVLDKKKTVELEDNKAEDLFADLEQKYTKSGVLLQGTRHREGLSQIDFSKKINVTQSDLSKMESGKRSIGKIIAKRIEKSFGVPYRYFLE